MLFKTFPLVNEIGEWLSGNAAYTALIGFSFLNKISSYE